jgi:hypothetical protein
MDEEHMRIDDWSDIVNIDISIDTSQKCEDFLRLAKPDNVSSEAFLYLRARCHLRLSVDCFGKLAEAAPGTRIGYIARASYRALASSYLTGI